MFPDARVASFIGEAFIPVKLHVKKNTAEFERFKAQWTPTQLVIDPADASEVHRIEGFSPVEDFLAQLQMGRAKWDFAHQRFPEAERRFRDACERYPKSGAAPEACYWAGVAAYKSSKSPEPLRETARVLDERYHDSEWARKASVWMPAVA